MKSVLRGIICVVVGIAVFLTANGMFVRLMSATQFEEKATYDVAAASLTVLMPAVVAGLVDGLVGADVAVWAFVADVALLGVVCLVRGPVWMVPGIGGAAASSLWMRIMLRSPVALIFGVATAWVGAQFASGRFSLADREKVSPAPDQD